MSFPRSTDQPPPPQPIVRRPSFLASVPERVDPKHAAFPRGERGPLRGPVEEKAPPSGGEPDELVAPEDRAPGGAGPAPGGSFAASQQPAPLLPAPGEPGTSESRGPAPGAGARGIDEGGPARAGDHEPPAPGPRMQQAAEPPLREERQAEPRSTEAEAELLGRLGASVEVLRLQSERLAEQARADALEIGFQVARRILEIELSTSPESLFSLVRSAIRRAGESRSLQVRLHPADKALIESQGGAERIDPLVVAAVELVADPLLSRGDCVVEADFGTVDGRLDGRLAELRRAVTSTFDEDPR